MKWKKIYKLKVLYFHGFSVRITILTRHCVQENDGRSGRVVVSCATKSGVE